MSDVIRLTTEDKEDGRFSRFELISWWDQNRLTNARVVVIGAGALGNELLKNLALLGVGNVFIADLDRIEKSNLSRSILYRESDCGRMKADVAAERAREIYSGLRTQSFVGNIVHDLGLGLYRWADVILGGLDNREARVSINQSAARVGKVWIDGAIERLDGVARVFNAATGPCYECTMSDIDWKMLEARRSCALLTREEMDQGKVPTTPTTASVVAGIQTQEAVKLIHGMQTLSGQGFVFDGMWHQSYLVNYSRLEDCPAHESFEAVEELPLKVAETRVGDFLERVRRDIGPQAVIEVNSDLLESLTCLSCDKTEPLHASLGKVNESQGRCPDCGENRRPNVYHTIGDQPALLDCTLAELGVPPWDILTGREGLNQKHYEFTGDREQILGQMAKERHQE
ncbi:MAG: ThiF family adenylyltransferase [Rhodopirellula sp.]|nr:ThiF family adenylyltransferase [Rhodopirellula sp.]